MTLPLPILILPAWRYHATQGGKIFRTAAELAEAEAQGWRDSPAAAAAVDINGRGGGTGGVTPPLLEAMPDDGIVAALEGAEEAIEEVQQVVAKKRKR